MVFLLQKIKIKGLKLKMRKKLELFFKKLGTVHSTYFRKNAMIFFSNSIFLFLVWNLCILIQNFILFTFKSLVSETRENSLVVHIPIIKKKLILSFNKLYSMSGVQFRCFYPSFCCKKIDWDWEWIIFNFSTK